MKISPLTLLSLGIFWVHPEPWAMGEESSALLRQPAGREIDSLMAWGSLEEAQRVAQRWVESDPSNPEAWRDLGLVLLSAPRGASGAASALERSLSLAPEWKKTQLFLAVVYRRIGNEQRAGFFEATSLEFADGIAQDYLWLARARAQSGDSRGAADLLTFGLSRCREDPFLLLMELGAVQVERNRLFEAFEAYSKAAAIRPDDPQARESCDRVGRYLDARWRKP